MPGTQPINIHNPPFWLPLFFVGVVALACTENPSANSGGGGQEPTDQPAAPSDPTAAVATAVAATPPPVDWDLKVRGLIRELGTRQACNDLNGCAMVQRLTTLGPAAVPAVRRAYSESNGDAFWRMSLLDTLGRMGGKGTAVWLLRLANTDPKRPMRARAALALARLAPTALKVDVKRALAGLDPKADRAVILALAYALAAAGDDHGRALIREHLTVPEAAQRWDMYRPGIRAAGQLRMVDMVDRLAQFSERADPFVRREAVAAMSAIRDRSAIPALIARLKDPIPGVREEAEAALRALTGLRHRTGHAAWSRWWARENAPAPK